MLLRSLSQWLVMQRSPSPNMDEWAIEQSSHRYGKYIRISTEKTVYGQEQEEWRRQTSARFYFLGGVTLLFWLSWSWMQP
jgi:hypothetical protein